MEVLIQFTPIKSRILTQLPDYVNLTLFETLSFKGTGYFFAPRFQNGQWDGVTRMYNPKLQTFRSGFLLIVTDILYQLGISVVVENYPPPLTFCQHSSNYSLRPYQIDIVNSILTYRFGVAQAPPRTGKTHIAGAVYDSLRIFPSIFYCRSVDLARQTLTRFAIGEPEKNILPMFTDIKVGMVGDGEFELGDITIITIQSAFPHTMPL